MADFLVRRIPPETMEVLRELAKRNRRSLQSEVQEALAAWTRPQLRSADFLAITERLVSETAERDLGDVANLIRVDRDGADRP